MKFPFPPIISEYCTVAYLQILATIVTARLIWASMKELHRIACAALVCTAIRVLPSLFLPVDRPPPLDRRTPMDRIRTILSTPTLVSTKFWPSFSNFQLPTLLASYPLAHLREKCCGDSSWHWQCGGQQRWRRWQWRLEWRLQISVPLAWRKCHLGSEQRLEYRSSISGLPAQPRFLAGRCGQQQFKSKRCLGSGHTLLILRHAPALLLPVKGVSSIPANGGRLLRTYQQHRLQSQCQQFKKHFKRYSLHLEESIVLHSIKGGGRDICHFLDVVVNSVINILFVNIIITTIIINNKPSKRKSNARFASGLWFDSPCISAK